MDDKIRKERLRRCEERLAAIEAEATRTALEGVAERVREPLDLLDSIEMTDNGDGRSLLSPAEYQKYERAVDMLAVLALLTPAKEETT